MCRSSLFIYIYIYTTNNFYVYKTIFPHISEDNVQENKDVKQEKKEANSN
jgi:hypothetical protein